MNKFIKLITGWWNNSTGFRHAVTTWLGIQLAVPLAQIAVWAESQGQQPLPNWHQAFATLGYATIGAGISALLKILQQKRAFPTK